MCYTITSVTLRVKHCDGRSELAFMYPVFSEHQFWNQLRQILQTNHSNSYQCRVQLASLRELSQNLLKFSCKHG